MTAESFMRSYRNRRTGSDNKKRDWDDWQRYVRKETQRLMQRSGRQVVEVSFAEHESAPRVHEEPTGSVEMPAPEPYEDRRVPVPGVPREEALELSDDEIGRTVKPYTIEDYRNIRPLTSDDLFATGEVPVSEPAEEIPAVDDPVETESMASEPIPIETAPVKAPMVAPEKPSRDGKPKKSKKGRGRRKKDRHEGELELFDSVSEHQMVTRERLTRKTKLEREQLIEKLLDPVISLEEAATLIGVCKTTVRRYTNKGELECLRTPGQQRRFKLSQVLAFVKKREEEQKGRKARKKKST